MAWLTNWNYRKSVTISNTGSALTDYQVLITVDTAILISAGKMRSDCGDIRFTSSDGSTLLNYWIESGINTASTKIWIKSTLAIGSNIVHMYYGNPGATSTSSATSVFEFFDDYDDNNIADWTAISCGFSPSYGATGGKAYVSETGSGGCIHLRKGFSVTTGVWETSLRLSAVNGGNNFDLGGFTLMWDGVTSTFYPNNGYVVFLTGQSGYDRLIFAKYSAGTGIALIDVAWAADAVEHKIKVTRDSSNRFEIFLDGVSKGSVIDSTYTSLSYIGLWGLGGGGGWPKTFYWDNTSVRKYASPEPTFGISGTEETPANITATSMTISTSESPCRVGICTVTVGATWINNGGSSSDFIPNITIDGIPYSSPYPLQSLGPGLSDTKTFIVSNLAIGARNICPYPN